MNPWWQTLLATAVGAIVGGVVLLFSQYLQGLRESKAASEEFDRRRAAMRVDDQRRWMVDLQQIIADTARSTHAVMHHHFGARTSTRPSVDPQEDENRVYSAYRKCIEQLSIVSARVNDQQLSDQLTNFYDASILVDPAEGRERSEIRLDEMMKHRVLCQTRIGELLKTL